MVIAAPWTAVRNTPNKSLRQNVARLGIVIHHAAMTNLNELERLEMGAKQVSSSVIVKDGEARLMFSDDNYRAWSLADAYWDSAMRSVETCNQSTIGWTISDASYETLAKVVAFYADKDGFWPHRDGDPKTWTVIGHKEVNSIHGGSYGTYCPGNPAVDTYSMNVDRVTRMAQEILLGETLTNIFETGIEDWRGTNRTIESVPVPRRSTFGFQFSRLAQVAEQIYSTIYNSVFTYKRADGSENVSQAEWIRRQVSAELATLGEKIDAKASLTLTSEQIAELAAALAPKVSASIASAQPKIDYSAIATAVNDDLNRRTAE